MGEGRRATASWAGQGHLAGRYKPPALQSCASAAPAHTTKAARRVNTTAIYVYKYIYIYINIYIYIYIRLGAHLYGPRGEAGGSGMRWEGGWWGPSTDRPHSNRKKPTYFDALDKSLPKSSPTRSLPWFHLRSPASARCSAATVACTFLAACLCSTSCTRVGSKRD